MKPCPGCLARGHAKGKKNGAPPRFERGASCKFENEPKAGYCILDTCL
jgi:hypothetical protein